MRIFALSLATVATLALAAPAFAQADVTVRTGHPATGHPTMHKKVIIKHDMGRDHMGRGWHQGRHYGAHRAYGSAEKVIIKKKPGRTVIKKFD